MEKNSDLQSEAALSLRDGLKMKKIKKEFTALVFLSVIQIILLITLVPSNSYVISQTNEYFVNTQITQKSSVSEFLKEIGGFLSWFFSIKQIGVVSAQGDNWCCSETNNGAICQGIDINDPNNICPNGNEIQTSCEESSQCQTGTCVDEESGTCSVQSSRAACESNGGTFHEESINEIEQCTQGCCISNGENEKQYIRDVACADEESDDVTFDSTVPQSQCRVLSSQRGACMFDNGDCRVKTEQWCGENGGEFFNGFLCTSTELTEEEFGVETNCEKTEQTTCNPYDEGKVYFVDSCGNPANVYDAGKVDDTEYWSYIKNPSESCNLNLNDDNSIASCGNCGSFASTSSCTISDETDNSPNYGDYVCEDLRCDVNEDGTKDRLSGESWCRYESQLGESNDVVGSLHWRGTCSQGEVSYDNCGNYRGNVCGEKTIEDNNGNEISIAQCRPNEGGSCFNANEDLESYEYNDDGELIDEDETFEENNETCSEASSAGDCRLESIEVEDHFKFDVCVPRYTKGYDLTQVSESSYDVCEIATQECTTVWRKNLANKWVCKGNCDCLTKEFANQMNDLCISLGDCGGFVNVEGTYTKNFETLEKNDLNNEFESRILEGAEVFKEEHNRPKPSYKVTADGDIEEDKKDTYTSYAENANIGTGILPNYFSSAQESIFAGDPLEEIGSIEDIKDFSTLFQIGLSLIYSLVLMALGVPAIYAGALGTALKALLKWLGLLEVKEVPVEFECKAWSPPTGVSEDTCSSCNEGELPCTQYRCKSLGANCRIEQNIYEAENPVCVAIEDDGTAPTIYDKGVITEGYSFSNGIEGEGVNVISDSGETIPEGTSINLTLGTKKGDEGEYAKCIYNWEPIEPDPNSGENGYQNIREGEEFEERNNFAFEHTAHITIPSMDNENVDVESGNSVESNREGTSTMYVRCEDMNGNFNFNEYSVTFGIGERPDNTPPNIMNYLPENGSYIPYGENKSSLQIELNEPSECKWDEQSGRSFENMENGFIFCEDYNPNEVTSRWNCNTELTGLTEAKNTINIKCEDMNGNINTQDFVYALHSTQSPLEITSISPQGEVSRGESPLNIELTAETSGGVNNGVSECRYKFIEPESGGDRFFETNSDFHKQTGFNLLEGNYDIKVTCRDEAGNTATGNAVFELKVDSRSPEIVRVFKDGGSLKLITDENAQCYSHSSTCNFDFDEEGVSDMSSTYTNTHTTEWTAGREYHIKCEDVWENRNNGCAIIISTTE